MMKNRKHMLAVALITVFVILALGSASTSDVNPMTRAVEEEVRAHGRSMDNFRFMVSTNVTLTLVRRGVDTIADRVVQETVVRNIIHLNANTRGRLHSGCVDTGLNVFFEDSNRDPPPTLTFVQKPGHGDRFYFRFESHPTLTNVVMYDGIEYQVTWQGNEEPFLLYERIRQERTHTRTMRGVN